MFLEILPYSIDSRKINTVVSTLRNDGVVVIPTDGVYSFACDLTNKKALEKLAKLKNIKLSKANFSLVFADLSTLSEYTKPIGRNVYKAMNKALPGPYTFILEANSRIPKLFDSNKKEVGIRIPDNNILKEIVNDLGNPLAVSSVHDEDEILEYTADPNEIFERFDGAVDIVIDGGMGSLEPSTVISCINNYIEVIRVGSGSVDFL